MEIFAGLHVHVSDDFDSDAAPDDYPLEGVVEGFYADGLVVVRHDDLYVEHVRREWFWACYRAL